MSNELNTIIQQAQQRNPENKDVQMLIQLVQQYHNACAKNDETLEHAKRVIGDHALHLSHLRQSLAMQKHQSDQVIQSLRTRLAELETQDLQISSETQTELQDYPAPIKAKKG